MKDIKKWSELNDHEKLFRLRNFIIYQTMIDAFVLTTILVMIL